MTISMTSRRLAALILPMVLTVAAVGCGVSAASPEPADPALAGKSLTAALDAWKGGETPASLSSPDRETPIRVIDEDWSAGLKLVSYKADADPHALGGYLRARVALTLRNARGKTVRKTVAYDVTTAPNVSVMRHE